jgi:hypothetical protein
MADFYVYARIHHAGRGFYLAAVTAQSVLADDNGTVEEVRWCLGLSNAESARKDLTARMHNELYRSGHRPILVNDEATARRLMPR